MRYTHRSMHVRAATVGTSLLFLIFLEGLPDPALAQLTLTENSGSAKASAQFFGTGLPSQQDEESFGPFGGVAVAEVRPFGRVRAAQTGSGLNAVTAEARLPGDIPRYSLAADTEIDWMIENTGHNPEALFFDFILNGGELRLFGERGRFASQTARVSVDIFALSPGLSGFLWSWILTLEEVGGRITAEYSFISDPLGLGQPSLSPITVSGNEAMVSISPFRASFDLGTLLPSGQARINYSMSAEVLGPAFQGSEGGKATLGDPFDVTGKPGTVISFRSGPGTPTVVPEPGTLLLLGSGLAGLGAAHRRRRRAGPRVP